MIFLKQYGAGDRVFVCLHGWGGGHREFAPVAARLPAGVCLLSLDLPGYGESPPPAQWNLEAIVESLAEALGRRRALPCSLAGFCSGAILALMLAKRLPGQIERIVLIDPFAFVPWYFRIFLAGRFGRRAYASTFRSRRGRAIANWILQRMQKSNADFTQAFQSLDHDSVLRYLELFDRIDLRRDIGPIEAPIHIVFGENTFGAVRRSIGVFRQLWPHATVETLAGIGHLPLIEGRRPLRRILFGATAETPSEARRRAPRPEPD